MLLQTVVTGPDRLTEKSETMNYTFNAGAWDITKFTQLLIARIMDYGA
jgi:hypothetical protein